ncbi:MULTISPECIES: hypothetical protein [Streptomyces]|uniref:Uncharacterized protein n=1 Tax=Streptomyces tsukubensis (strain DSM 42081 / NBRC 108919 / NRRL 18488 / 9993) TaxID=1114943 RepID=I2N020_STRT9|nr:MULTISPECIES: hypothetical protein [Streptomyces]AZK94591.1 hypothetical protein B7R87_12505 [Streptomyces tsukubensis]EIF90367.1 hypothetical protein [Streptomyces tsukubensis NRRL18488]MYS65458.1 hypothetical protein [Streptomyces sp. SID5473]QKM69322.1 hypothetical protein STSU_021265 [Streptomyces tsukubensis NRRL18488]TAI42746.1 hypothetical protein EWI31_20270 [Streptomyces tsukubensis]
MQYFVRGLFLGGFATGLLLLLPAALVQAVAPDTVRTAAFTAAAVVFLAIEIRLLPFRMPQNARLVPSDIVVRTDGSGALQFGFEMGTGLRTFVPSHLPYVAIAALLFAGPWWATPLGGLAFALGRALMVRSSVRSGDASAWDAAFVERRRRILWLLWVIAVCAGTVAVLIRHGNLPW